MTDEVERIGAEGALQVVGRARVVRCGDDDWVVRELAAPDYDRRAGTSLVFETPSVMRRVRTFPANWRDLPDQDLCDLSPHF